MRRNLINGSRTGFTVSLEKQYRRERWDTERPIKQEKTETPASSRGLFLSPITKGTILRSQVGIADTLP